MIDRKLIDDFIRPLAQRLENQLCKIDGKSFAFYKCEIGLAQKPNSPMDALWIHSDSKYDSDNDELEKQIPKTHSVRIDFMASGKSSDTLAFVNIFSDILIEKSGYYIKALKKSCRYENLPDFETQNELFDCYKCIYEQVAFDTKPRVIKCLN